MERARAKRANSCLVEEMVGPVAAELALELARSD